MAESVQDAVERAANFGSKAEALIFAKGGCPMGDRRHRADGVLVVGFRDAQGDTQPTCE